MKNQKRTYQGTSKAKCKTRKKEKAISTLEIISTDLKTTETHLPTSNAKRTYRPAT
jgi:hypothetical protein